jgi:hypothetical protein
VIAGWLADRACCACEKCGCAYLVPFRSVDGEVQIDSPYCVRCMPETEEQAEYRRKLDEDYNQ